jgi:hypothetical protein
MTLEIDFLPFAIGDGAGVESQANWAVDTVVTNGFVTGTAQSTQVNKAVRQPSFVSAAIANYMGNVLNQNILDNGVLDDFWSQFWQSLLLGDSFIDSGTANAIVVAVPVAGLSFPAPVAGLAVTVQIAATNNGATTLNWMGNGNAAVTTIAKTALIGTELIANGYATFVFDGTEWQLTNFAPGFTTAKGYANRAVTITQNYSVIAGDGGKNINVGANGLTVTFTTGFVNSANGPVVIGNYSGYSSIVTAQTGAFIGTTSNGQTSITIPNKGWIAVEPDGSNLRIVAADASTMGASGNFAVTLNQTVGGTLSVTGNTTLSGILNTTGAVYLSSSLSVTGNTTLNGNLSVAGTTTLNSLGVTDNTTIGGTLDVTGSVTGTNLYVATGVFANYSVFTNSGTFTVPSGVTVVEVELWSGGGAGLGGNGASGAAGGYSLGIFTVTSGAHITVTVGLGGSTVSANGGTSSFGAMCSATGGTGGTAGPGPGGAGSGGYLNLSGQSGTDLDGSNSNAPGGNAPRGGLGGTANTSAIAAATIPGGGGAAGAGSSSVWGSGANGLVIIRW